MKLLLCLISSFPLSGALWVGRTTGEVADVAPPVKMFDGQTIDTTAFGKAMQRSFRLKAKVKFNSMNNNYPNLFRGNTAKGKRCFETHGLGPAYKKRKGKAGFYLQTTTKLGPHGRGIQQNGGWLPSAIRLDDAKWHVIEYIKGTAGLALLVDGKRVEGSLKGSWSKAKKFIMKKCTSILVGNARGGGNSHKLDGEVGDVQIWAQGKQVFGNIPEGSRNLALGLVPTGSTESKWGHYSGATDGIMNRVWHAANRDIPANLVLELNAPSKIDGMKFTMPGHLNYGFKTLEIFRSDDGKSWDMVRSESGLQCKAARITEHDGWSEVTKFVKIVMKDLCGGAAFAISEWEVFGVPAENLALGIVPTGSSDSHWGRYPDATDGTPSSWHANNGDHPSYLILNLGLPTRVSGMNLEVARHHANYGWKTLKIFRSMDGVNWQAVRTDSTPECKKGRLTYHPGFPEEAKFVKIEMSDRCGGQHFALAEWQVFGWQKKCKGQLLSRNKDRFPCDSVKKEGKCRKSYMKMPTGETFQCGVRKASDDVFNCLVVKECDIA